jgi:hypothetical protein
MGFISQLITGGPHIVCGSKSASSYTSYFWVPKIPGFRPKFPDRPPKSRLASLRWLFLGELGRHTKTQPPKKGGKQDHTISYAGLESNLLILYIRMWLNVHMFVLLFCHSVLADVCRCISSYIRFLIAPASTNYTYEKCISAHDVFWGMA